jgi:hypothetical protein
MNRVSPSSRASHSSIHLEMVRLVQTQNRGQRLEASPSRNLRDRITDVIAS